MFESWACWLRLSPSTCIGWPQRTDDWSVVWNALAAIFTGAAVLWAVRSTIEERRLRRKTEEKLDEERKEESLRKSMEPAKQVMIWHTEVITGGKFYTSETEFYTKPMEVKFDIGCYNASSTPITSLGFGFFKGSNVTYLAKSLPVLHPGKEITFESETFSLEDANGGETFVSFFDSSGRYCRRTSNGGVSHILIERTRASEAIQFVEEDAISQPAQTRLQKAWSNLTRWRKSHPE